MKALIDGDILRYEIGFASEVAWREVTDSIDPPPFDFVQSMLVDRVNNIVAQTDSTEYLLYLTEGKTFRDEIGKTKVYKGHRANNKPWHYENISVFMKNLMPHKVVTGIEADDAMAIDHINTEDPTIICSRDKDLRQIPGMLYSWELGKQPEFGPVNIDPIGDIDLSDNHKSIRGTGFKFFCSQVITGDTVDNIPGLQGCGPVRAYELLKDVDDPDEMTYILLEEYSNVHPNDPDMLIEQGQLCWIVRRFKENGEPELWTPGLIS